MELAPDDSRSVLLGITARKQSLVPSETPFQGVPGPSRNQPRESLGTFPNPVSVSSGEGPLIDTQGPIPPRRGSLDGEKGAPNSKKRP